MSINKHNMFYKRIALIIGGSGTVGLSPKKTKTESTGAAP